MTRFYEKDEEDYDGGRIKKKQKKSELIDDVLGDDYSLRKRNSRRGSEFFDDIAAVASDDKDEEEDDGDADFIDVGKELQNDDEWRVHRQPFLPQEEEQDVEDLERLIKKKYGRSDHLEYEEETTQVAQQALLPSVKDPKLWMVKCAIGHEREVAFCLMQKCMDVQSQGIKQPIKSVITLDYLTNYIYIEADKEAHVKEACKGMRHIYSNTKPMLVPIKEMTDVLSVKSKAVELSKDTWVRVKLGTYKGDLAKVLDVDNVRQRVTIKLIPRIDLKALANKLEGNEVGKKKKNFVPPPRFINTREMKYMHIPVERRRDSITGEYFETIDGMMFKDGYLYKTVSMKSISSQNIQPSFDELEKFRKPGKDSDGDMASLSTVFAYRTEGHFMKGDAVIVVRGNLKNLMGWVEKETLAVNEKELCKYFKPGDHVKVVSGAQEGATGMVVKVEGHVLIISSDTTKEDVSNFASLYTCHCNSSCGVIIRVESDAFQVLKGVPERAEVVWVKSREIRKKIKRKRSTQDRYGSTVSLKDVVRIHEGEDSNI
ncbi:hypothetical protein AMTRI_Chr13g117550 [Amborella trichopoda]